MKFIIEDCGVIYTTVTFSIMLHKMRLCHGSKAQICSYGRSSALHNGHRGVSDWIKQDFIHTEHSHELHRDGMAQVVRSELELCE